MKFEKFLARLLHKATDLVHLLLSPFICEEKLAKYKPIHLCWWYDKLGERTPDYFISTHITTPSVTTGSASSITGTGFTMAGSIDSTGGANATVRGFAYVTGAGGTPTTSDPVVSQSGSYGTGSFSLPISGLASGTTYSVRAYAINSAGTAYGSTVEVTTANIAAPTMTTSAASSITATTATANGNITAINGSNATVRGFVWSTSIDPTTASNEGIVNTSGSYGTGAYTGSMTGLTPGTTYYYRAYATNTTGTGYGSSVSFKTTAVPTITPNGQYLNDFTTTIPVGWGTEEQGITDNIYLQADISNGGDPATSTVIPKAEIEPVGTAFDNTANNTLRSRTYRNNIAQYAKRGSSLVYDAHNKRYLSFGGYDGTTRYNEVWEKYIDSPGQKWQRLTVSGTPPTARNMHAATVVSGNLTSGGAYRAYMIVWGGYTNTDNSDMWSLRIDTPGSEEWQQITQTSSPSNRAYLNGKGHMVSTPVSGNTDQNHVYLFGGWATSRVNDLYRCTFDVDTPTAVTWTTLKANGATGNPPARSGAVMDYKASTHKIYLFGGYSGSAMLNDFWEYDIATNTWTNMSPSGTAPAGSENLAGGYDAENDRFWFTGGSTTSASFATGLNSIGYVQNVGSSPSYVNVRANTALSGGNQSYPGNSFAGFTVDPDKGWLVLYNMATLEGTERYGYIIDFNEGVTSNYPVYSIANGDYLNARDAMASVWNPDANEWVQIGGLNDMHDDGSIITGVHSSDVWAYNPTTNSWRYAVSGYKSIPHLEGSVAVYDTLRKRIILFGGLNQVYGTSNEFYELIRDDFGNYKARRMNPSGSATPRWLSAAAYDATNDRMIIAFGSDNVGIKTDVIALNFGDSGLNSTSKRDGALSTLTPSGSATAIAGPGYVNVTSDNRLYIFGGATNTGLTTVTNQLVYLDYSTTNGAWTAPGTTNAVARRTPVLGYDATNTRLIAWSGFDGSNVRQALQYYNISSPGSWTTAYDHGPTGSPDARRSAIGQWIGSNLYINSGRPNTGTWFKDTWALTPNYTTPSSSTWEDKDPKIKIPVYFPFTGGTLGEDYHWQAWTTEGATDSAKVSFGSNLESDIDFNIGLNAPVVALNTADETTFTTNTPTLEFTGTDAQSDDIRYEVRISDSSTFIIDQNPASGDAYTAIELSTDPTTGRHATGQAITGKSGHVIGVDFYLVASKAPTGQLVASIYNATGTVGSTAIPTGSPLVESYPIDASTIGKDWGYVYFQFQSSYELTGGAYVVVLELQSPSADSSNIITVGANLNSHYGNYSRLTINTTEWSPSSTFDTHFRLYSGMLSANSGVATNITTYYFDGSITTLDPDGAWNNEANATDGSISTGCVADGLTNDNGSSTTDELILRGTNIVELPQAIKARVYAGRGTTLEFVPNTLNIAIYTEGGVGVGELIGTTSITSWASPAWTDYIELDTPTGGWTLDKAQKLEAICWTDGDNGVGQASIRKIEVDVTTYDSTSIISSADLNFTGFPDNLDPFASGQSIEFTAERDIVSIADSYDYANGDADHSFSDGSSYDKPYQTFTGNGGKLQSISVPLKVTAVDSSYQQSVSFAIYAHSGTYGSTGVTTGSPIAVSDTTFNTYTHLTATYNTYTFYFSGENAITLQDGVNYVLVGTGGNRGGTGGSYYTYWLSDSSSPTHDGNAGVHSLGTDYLAGVDRVFSISTTISSPLSDGTYYWHVRGIDPNGSNTWGEWSATRQFIIDTAASGLTGYKQIKVGSSWVAKPVKIYNGSSWVQKPVKIYNGSSWVASEDN